MIWFLACVDDPVTQYRDALRDGRCDAVADDALRDDCWVAMAGEGTGDTCAQVTDTTLRGECWFRLAEARSDAALCPQAVPFAEDCALHVLSRGFATGVPRGLRPGRGEDDAAARIVASGLAVTDMRPWSAWYRWVLGQNHPLDRAACLDVVDPDRREACLHTALALYGDLLNNARDRGTYPCDGSPLPAVLQYTPDPELDALRAGRTDLCSR